MTTFWGKSCQFGVLCCNGRLSVCKCASFPFAFEGGLWDLIV